jgi:Ca2+-binding RTX toxin-like protein
MIRRLAILAGAAGLLAVPGIAAADSTLNNPQGNFVHYSEDVSLKNEYTVFQQGNDIHFRETKDPQGTNGYPFDDCRAIGPKQSGNSAGFEEIICPRSIVKSVAVEPGPGEDTVRITLAGLPVSAAGGNGSDDIQTGDTADDVNGEQGSDKLVTAGGDDILAGEDGNDTIDAGAGNDKINGGNGEDVIVAGPGDDTIRSADGLAEKIDCGDGNDTVVVDAEDVLTGCESVTTQNVTAAPEEQAAGDDKTAPKITVGGSSSQRAAKKSVRFFATCSEKGIVQAIGYVDAAGINSALKGFNKKVDVGGGGVMVTLKLQKSVMRNITADLRKKRKPRVRVTIACVDAAGNTSSPRKFWVGLRR